MQLSGCLVMAAILFFSVTRCDELARKHGYRYLVGITMGVAVGIACSALYFALLDFLDRLREKRNANSQKSTGTKDQGE
jgi:hypothetical protein